MQFYLEKANARFARWSLDGTLDTGNHKIADERRARLMTVMRYVFSFVTNTILIRHYQRKIDTCTKR